MVTSPARKPARVLSSPTIAVARKGFGESVESARKDLREEINRLVGGENPELVARLSPLLDTFGRNMNERVAKQTSELLEKAARQFDTSDPTSPMAKHAKGLREQQDALSLTLVKNHEALTVKVDQLTTAGQGRHRCCRRHVRDRQGHPDQGRHLCRLDPPGHAADRNRPR